MNYSWGQQTITKFTATDEGNNIYTCLHEVKFWQYDNKYTPQKQISTICFAFGKLNRRISEIGVAKFRVLVRDGKNWELVLNAKTHLS